MAIQMRRGLYKDFDPTKMLPGEWAVAIDSDTNNQVVWMCFAPGFVKRMGTYEDFKQMINDITGEIKEEYISEFNAIVAVAEEYANMTKENKDIVAEYVKTSHALMEMSEDYSNKSKQYSEAATNMASLATSYAVGTNDVIRSGDSTDNAKYYKEQSEKMYKCTYFGVCNSESSSRGKEITIDNLPEDLKIGQVVRVLFTNGNTYLDKTVPILLIINGKYTYELYHFGNFLNAKAGMTYEFVKTRTSSLSLLNTNPIANNLTTTEKGFALDATQGKELDDKIKENSDKTNELKTLINTNVATLTKRCTDIEAKNGEQDTEINDVEIDISRVKTYLRDEWDTSSLPDGITISYYTLGLPDNDGITAKDGEYCLDVTTGSVYYFSGYNNTWSKRYQLHKLVTPDDISSIKEKNAEQDESIGTLQEQLGAIPDTYATKEEVDSLEIGGRNLIAGTEESTTVTASSETFKFASFYFTDGALKVDQSYTVSADIEVLAGTVTAVSVGVYDDSSVEWITAAAEIVDGHIHATFKPKTPNKTKLLIYAGISGSTAGNSIKISKLKFEKGDKATDWTPAPEDVDSRLKTLEGKDTIDKASRLYTYNSQTYASDNSYYKIATFTITTQYLSEILYGMIYNTLGGTGVARRLEFGVEVKQQLELGNAPVCSVRVFNYSGINPDQLALIITQNTTEKTVVELWGKITIWYSKHGHVFYSKSSGVEINNDMTLQASLPSGTCKYGEYANDNIANNLTTTKTGMVLDATQGKVLNDRIESIGKKTGTWTPTYSGTGTLVTSKCEYYKIGNLVYVYIMLGLGGTVTSGRVCSVTLPFTSASTYKLPIGIQSQSLTIDTSLGSGAYISDNKVYFTPTTGGSGSFVICITGMYPVSE